ncbi:MAG TPA: PAS domain-containing sensor histidine kinase [Candidatus Thermoplasmatota archaeon]|nr:PAS domain-containing sensor histidine kinase [Candidatus Thermoplasmatota archaeon]
MAEGAAAAPSWLARLRRGLPEGLELPRATWEARHRTVLVVLFAHAAFLAAFGIYRGWGLAIPLAEGGIVAGLAGIATPRHLSRRMRSATAALGCVTSSAVLVQFSGGYIEAHFHFFVMVALVALYQDWVPFLLAVVYVAVDHGIIGTLAPSLVYNHHDATAHPWKWAGIHAAMVLAECGALIAFWGGAEQAKVRSDLVLDSAGEGIIGLGLDHKVAFINRSGAALLGRPADDLVGSALTASLVDAAGAPIAFPALPPGRVTAPPRIAVEGTVRRGGEPLPVEWVVTPTLRAGIPVGHVVTLRDISERKRAEAELQGSLSMLTATLESTADAILVVDSAGRIVNFNQRFVAMWRIPPEVLATRDDAKALACAVSQLKSPEAFLQKVRELYAATDAESVDVLEFADGRVVERSSRPQRVGGRSVGRVWSFRDITEERRAEGRRAQQVASLRQVERLLEQDRFKTQLLNTASHELNTPISALRLQLHLLKSHLPPHMDERSLRGFQVLDRNVERLGALVRDTLDVARIEGGRLRLRVQAMDLARLAAETCQSMEGLAKEKQIRLAVTGAKEAPLEGDPARCTQVLFNLVANALKFTPAGGSVTVTVGQEGGKAWLRVQDTGVGIDPGQASLLFQPFSQLHDGQMAPGGTGLGLYISRGIIEQHGGRIWCESLGAGKGSLFAFELPLTAAPQTNLPAPKAPAR